MITYERNGRTEKKIIQRKRIQYSKQQGETMNFKSKEAEEFMLPGQSNFFLGKKENNNHSLIVQCCPEEETEDDSLDDDAHVVRGGTCLARQFAGGSGVTTDEDGKLHGVSVNSKNGLTVEQLSVGIPNGQIGVTTVKIVRENHGTAIPSPTLRNENHALLSGITAQKAEEIFKTGPNPSRIQQGDRNER